MNIQNIATLASQLKTIGFDNMGYAILKHICLAPANFSITEKLPKVPESISFIFYFEKEVRGQIYKLIYYDAILQQQLSFDNLNIEGLNMKGIDENMAQIDWKDVFDLAKRRPFNPDDKSGYENEIKVCRVIENLKQLETFEEGKSVSMALKQKHWSEIPYMDIMGAMVNGRGKSEISQRFYFSEGQPPISADEAYRFLLNRWLEKQMQLKKRQQDNDEVMVAEEAGASSGSGLLKKRRVGNIRKHKAAQN